MMKWIWVNEWGLRLIDGISGWGDFAVETHGRVSYGKIIHHNIVDVHVIHHNIVTIFITNFDNGM